MQNEIFKLDKDKYHSAILFGYCIDLIYFENIVFRELKRKGVLNVISFVDYKMLEQAFEWVKDFTALSQSTYSLSPFKSIGAFHPKIILLLGEKDALINIGSGNITYGGHGGNKEIWYSIKLNENQTDKLHFLYNIWNYIIKISDVSTGITSEKIEWAAKYCNLLKEIPEIINTYAFIKTFENEEIVFIDNHENGILNKLIEILPDDINEIKIYSPYFDSNFLVLNELISQYSNAPIKVFVQNNYIFFDPKDLSKIKGNVKFYNIDEDRFMHSKIIQFTYGKNKYLLLGSANLSVSAMGTKHISARNEEFVVLLKTVENYFEHLGFFENKEIFRIDIITLQKKEYSFSQDQKEINRDIFLYDIEQHENRFIIISDLLFDSSYILNIEDLNGQKELELILKSSEKIGDKYKNTFLYNKKINSNAKIGYLSSSNGKRISNKLYVHNYYELVKSNPNPSRKKLDNIIRAIDSGGLNVYEIINELNLVEHLSDNNQQGLTKRIKYNRKDNSEESQNTGEVLSYEEFMSIEENPRNTNMTFWNNKFIYNDLLKLWYNQLNKSYAENVTDDEEEDDVDKSEGREDFTEKKVIIRTENEIQRFRKSLLKTFDNFVNQLRQLYRKKKSIDLLENKFSFAAEMITTIVLLDSTFSKLIHKDTGEEISILSFFDNFNNDFVKLGLEIVGGFYSIILRKYYLSKEIIEKEDWIKECIILSAKNSTIILSIILAFANGNKKFINIIEIVKVVFYNMMDITLKNNVSVDIEIISEYIKNIFEKYGTIIPLKEDLVGSSCHYLFNSYSKKEIGGCFTKYNEFEINNIYLNCNNENYYLLRGFIKDGSNYKLKTSLPGNINFNDNINDFVSEFKKDYFNVVGKEVARNIWKKVE